MKQYCSTLFNLYGIDVYGYINVYDTKDEFLSEHCNSFEKEKLEYFKKRIKYDSGGRIGEIGWGLSLPPFSPRRNLRDVSRVEGGNIISYGLKYVKKYLYTDYIDGHDLYRIKGDILFSKPCGLAAMKIGDDKLAQRIGKICTRYGFSELDEYGYQFGMYNEELLFKPI